MDKCFGVPAVKRSRVRLEIFSDETTAGSGQEDACLGRAYADRNHVDLKRMSRTNKAFCSFQESATVLMLKEKSEVIVGEIIEFVGYLVSELQ